jgi:hypothetical protein
MQHVLHCDAGSSCALSGIDRALLDPGVTQN